LILYTRHDSSSGVVTLPDLCCSRTKRIAELLDSCSPSHHLDSRRLYEVTAKSKI
jgi:hypothetical protein